MRKTLLILAVLPLLLSCEKAITIDHHIAAEFPGQEVLEPVSVLFSEEGEADIRVGASGFTTSLPGAVQTVLPGGAKLLRYKALALVTGSSADAASLLEATFWSNPALQWVICLDPASDVTGFPLCGFVNCLRARGLSAADLQLYAGSNVYDKMSGFTVSPVRFTVSVKEDR